MRSKSDQLDQTSRPRAERETGKLSKSYNNESEFITYHIIKLMVFSMCERVDPAQVLYLPFSAFVPRIVCCSFLKAVQFYLSLNWFLCLLPGGELPAAHSKMDVATQRLQSTISLALQPSPTQL